MERNIVPGGAARTQIRTKSQEITHVESCESGGTFQNYIVNVAMYAKLTLTASALDPRRLSRPARIQA